MTLETIRPQIEAALFRGNKIEAIKLYREAAGCQLMEAKNAVEAIEKELRKSKPALFARRSSNGIAIRLVLIAIALVVLAYVLLR
jgi:hypothetical protein